MKNQQTSGTGLMCLTMILAIASCLLIAGCADTSQERQSPAAPAINAPTGQPATMSATTGPATVPKTQKTAQPTPTPASSTGVIRVDAISGKNAGDKFTLTGTTSLPEGTNILWQIMPDTGTPPTGLNPDSMMSAGGNYMVIKGEGTMNRIAVPVDLGRLIPGNYVALVGKMKGEPGSAPVFEIDKDYGYAYFTIKQAGGTR